MYFDITEMLLDTIKYELFKIDNIENVSSQGAPLNLINLYFSKYDMYCDITEMLLTTDTQTGQV